MDLSQLQVLYEDNHLIAVNKPAGWLVQGDITGDPTLGDVVKQYIKVRYNKPGDVFLGTIHRIDRPVSGVVIFARTTKGLQRMNKLFQERKVQKTYRAIVVERPKELSGKLSHYILKDKERNISKAYTRKDKGGKDAKLGELEYRFLGSIANHHLLEVKPLTGRPHQIRVQLAKMGCPIRGDKKYGAPVWNIDRFIHLHSYSLEFIHPVKKEPVTIIADVPDEQIWDKFRGLEYDYTE